MRSSTMLGHRASSRFLGDLTRGARTRPPRQSSQQWGSSAYARRHPAPHPFSASLLGPAGGRLVRHLPQEGDPLRDRRVRREEVREEALPLVDRPAARVLDAEVGDALLDRGRRRDRGGDLLERRGERRAGCASAPSPRRRRGTRARRETARRHDLRDDRREQDRDDPEHDEDGSPSLRRLRPTERRGRPQRSPRRLQSESRRIAPASAATTVISRTS